MQKPGLFLLSIVMICAATAARGQSSREYAGPAPAQQVTPENTAPEIIKEHAKPHKVQGWRLKRAGVKQTPEYEFYQRVELAAKEHQRKLKKLYKPQFSNFLYYGHKNKPVKHASNKMRYCKECGIRH